MLVVETAYIFIKKSRRGRSVPRSVVLYCAQSRADEPQRPLSTTFVSRECILFVGHGCNVANCAGPVEVCIFFFWITQPFPILTHENRTNSSKRSASVRQKRLATCAEKSMGLCIEETKTVCEDISAFKKVGKLYWECGQAASQTIAGR